MDRRTTGDQNSSLELSSSGELKTQPKKKGIKCCEIQMSQYEANSKGGHHRQYSNKIKVNMSKFRVPIERNTGTCTHMKCESPIT